MSLRRSRVHASRTACTSALLAAAFTCVAVAQSPSPPAAQTPAKTDQSKPDQAKPADTQPPLPPEVRQEPPPEQNTEAPPKKRGFWARVFGKGDKKSDQNPKDQDQKDQKKKGG